MSSTISAEASTASGNSLLKTQDSKYPKEIKGVFLPSTYTPIEIPCRVDKKYYVFKNVYCDFWPKEAKKLSEKTYVLIHVFINQVWARN
jgi:hypothetical protein